MHSNTRVMRAARITGPRTFIVEAAPIPNPGPRQVRFRVEGCGVCASNLGPWLGLPWIRYPLRPGESGHEAWGVVDAVGEDVSTVRVGQRIAAISYDSFAEYDVASADALIELPAEFAAIPFPGEALGCAMNIFERSRIEPGQDVAIVGVGFLGALLVRLAARNGARVLAISRRPESLALARRMGAQEAIAMDDHHQIISRVRELTDDRLCDRVIEATGQQWPLDLAAELTRTRGVLVIAGYHQDGPRQVNMQLWNWRGLDVVNAHERETSTYVRGMREALLAIRQNGLDPSPLYTHGFALERLGQAFDLAAERPAGFVKAVVVP
ncbi:MAG TPA: zinc-binding dehydrogenase [Polyangiaceae bacterium]